MSRPAGDQYTPQQVDECLTALIARNGVAKHAVAWLKAEGKKTPTASTLLSWARVHHMERYEELREKLAGVREGQLANEYLDAATHAIEVTRLAVEKAEAKLKAGKDEDPAKSAASLARVSQSMIEKRLTLQGRPTRITEAIDVEGKVAKLVAMGVLKLDVPDEQPVLEAGDAA